MGQHKDLGISILRTEIRESHAIYTLISISILYFIGTDSCKEEKG